MPGSPGTRTRRDRCPGVLRPWPAGDGALIRIRLIGGRLPLAALLDLIDISQHFGDGLLWLTGRANLQLRGLPSVGDRLAEEVVERIEATGLLPSRSHELARNVLLSPLSGLSGGRADLRGVAAELDRRLCADPALAALPGRFLFVLDDGRGDLIDRRADLGLVALGPDRVQVRIGSAWGPVLALAETPAALITLAAEFLAVRGDGPGAAWHIDELDGPLRPPSTPDPATAVRSAPLHYGAVPGGRHLQIADGRLDPAKTADLLAALPADLIVTPWHGILVADPERVR